MRVSHNNVIAKRVDHVLLALMMAVMITVAFLNILSRYLFHYSLAFTEELTVQLFVWVVVLGSGIAFERGAQLGVGTVTRFFPGRWQEHLRWLNAALGALLFLLVDICLIRECYFELTLFHARSPSLQVPVWIYYAGVVVASAFVFRGLYRGALRKNGTTAAGETIA